MDRCLDLGVGSVSLTRGDEGGAATFEKAAVAEAKNDW